MVRVISAESLGYGDYAARVYDLEVDGLAFDTRVETDYYRPPQPPQRKAKRMLLGQDVTSHKAS